MYLQAETVYLFSASNGMKLLFITQVIDKNDTVLGFVHRWLVEFSKHFEHITVICLQMGKYDVPKNVSVFSLGKEAGVSRATYVSNFYRIAFRERKNYDAVLVHMNQEYILLAGVIWKLLGKRVYMWRNHYSGSFLTDIAASFCTKVFCTSRSSYTAKIKKTVVMPVGIDVEVYKSHSEITRLPHSILFLARVAPSKRPHILLEALGELHKRGLNFKANLYGSPAPQDVAYLEGLKKRLLELSLADKAHFLPGLPYTEGPKVYSAHEIFVNLSPSGMYDKTIFEAAACETLVLASSLDFAKLVNPRFTFPQDDIQALSAKLEVLLSLSREARARLGKEIRALAIEKHSLKALGHRIKEELTTW
ncbi:MAG: hypothetical protein A3C06_02720 [Candidatus Taylorbacteria bacterium RIFCSPHIGHO2_02_FULL_46_13]|uniref:Glycosyl transferase family 1 domain-containing protein n=1 Tax=Candidatus Taylorbacteria bacterium RIFCSPHIGHO2_02_FULL_46_13 TaxID=1802312 RepID=A0A1G2MRH6_9BACT|nr:MAG: hypothetical protein A3C06_02720 [Candidatus Taylorbacteria bacterium RIFCSPHIGHO2_02_FULL_46_13]